MVTDSVSPVGESKKKYRDWTFSSVWDKEIQTVYAYDKESARRAKICLTCYYQKFPVTWLHITKKVSHLVSVLSLKFPMADWVQAL